MRGLQRKARLAGELPPSSAWSWLVVAWMVTHNGNISLLSARRTGFVSRGHQVRYLIAIVCFLEDERNVLSR